MQPAAESAGLGRVTWHQFHHIHSTLLNDLRTYGFRSKRKTLIVPPGVSFRPTSSAGPGGDSRSPLTWEGPDRQGASTPEADSKERWAEVASIPGESREESPPHPGERPAGSPP